jgi:hypothetical protein
MASLIDGAGDTEGVGATFMELESAALRPTSLIPGGAQCMLGLIAGLAEVPEAGVVAADLLSGRHEVGILAGGREMSDHAQGQRDAHLVEIVDTLSEREPTFRVPERQDQFGEVGGAASAS